MVKVDVSGIEVDLLPRIKQLLDLIDTNDILDHDAVPFLLNRIRTRFLAEHNPDDQPWPVSEAAKIRRGGGYTWSRGAKWTGTGTLFASGTLFRSIEAGLGFGPLLDINTRVIGTDDPVGVFHQFGTKKLPPRPFLGFNDQDASLLEVVLMQSLQDKLDKATS
jgi:phage gpG-like protein